MDMHNSSLADSNERWLREQGATAAEMREWLPVVRWLDEWPERHITPADTTRLLAVLLPVIPPMSSVRHAIQAHRQKYRSPLLRLLRLAHIQISLLRPPFWLTSVLIMALGVYVECSPPAALLISPTLVLRAIGPLFVYLGLISAFRGMGLHLLECELTCLPDPLQLLTARLIVVLTYDVGLGLCLSLASVLHSGASFWAVTWHWLMPLLLVAGLTLMLSLRFNIQMAAGLAYGVWLAVVAWSVSPALSSASAAGVLSGPFEYFIGMIGAGLVIGAVWRVTAVPSLLLRRN